MKTCKFGREVRREVESGDMITALGHSFVVGQVLYQDDCGKDDMMVEFLDPLGRIHSWKESVDGGYITDKAVIEEVWA